LEELRKSLTTVEVKKEFLVKIVIAKYPNIAGLREEVLFS